MASSTTILLCTMHAVLVFNKNLLILAFYNCENFCVKKTLPNLATILLYKITKKWLDQS